MHTMTVVDYESLAALSFSPHRTSANFTQRLTDGKVVGFYSDPSIFITLTSKLTLIFAKLSIYFTQNDKFCPKGLH